MANASVAAAEDTTSGASTRLAAITEKHAMPRASSAALGAPHVASIHGSRVSCRTEAGIVGRSSDTASSE